MAMANKYKEKIKTKILSKTLSIFMQSYSLLIYKISLKLNHETQQTHQKHKYGPTISLKKSIRNEGLTLRNIFKRNKG